MRTTSLPFAWRSPHFLWGNSLGFLLLPQLIFLFDTIMSTQHTETGELVTPGQVILCVREKERNKEREKEAKIWTLSSLRRKETFILHRWLTHIRLKIHTLFWWASNLIKEHFLRSPPISASVWGVVWLSRSCAARVRTSCWAAHCLCCEDSLEERQQAARALASSRGPTAEGS